MANGFGEGAEPGRRGRERSPEDHGGAAAPPYRTFLQKKFARIGICAIGVARWLPAGRKNGRRWVRNGPSCKVGWAMGGAPRPACGTEPRHLCRGRPPTWLCRGGRFLDILQNGFNAKTQSREGAGRFVYRRERRERRLNLDKLSISRRKWLVSRVLAVGAGKVCEKGPYFRLFSAISAYFRLFPLIFFGGLSTSSGRAQGENRWYRGRYQAVQPCLFPEKCTGYYRIVPDNTGYSNLTLRQA